VEDKKADRLLQAALFSEIEKIIKHSHTPWGWRLQNVVDIRF